MKSSLFKSFFSSGVQAIAVQVLSSLFFLISADYLSKDDFGIFSWVNATAVIITTIIGFGLDQVVVRRMAASKTSGWAAAAYLFHALAGSVVSFVILLLISLLFDEQSAFFIRINYLPWFFGAQALIYMGMPLKQFLNARQNFTPYAVIATVTNIIKILLIYVCIWWQNLSIGMVGIILTICGLIELGSLMAYLLLKTDFSFKFKSAAYTKLLKESFPQYISAVFDVSLSRLDWLLLGLLSTTAATAEYGIAYKAFEISRLPIAVIAPVILNIFARMFLGGNVPDAGKQDQIRRLYALEAFAAVLIPLCINILWAPVADYVFKGKYGSVNAGEMMILSVCIPLLFIINLLWTMVFSIKKYKEVSFITFVSAICNFVLNIILIPIYGGIGAAVSFLVTIVVQLLLYYRLVHKYIMTFSLLTLVLLFAGAAVAYRASIYITGNLFIQLPLAIIIYCAIAIITKTITKNHLETLKLLFKK